MNSPYSGCCLVLMQGRGSRETHRLSGWGETMWQISMATKGTGDTGYHSDYERPVQSYVYCCYGDCPGWSGSQRGRWVGDGRIFLFPTTHHRKRRKRWEIRQCNHMQSPIYDGSTYIFFDFTVMQKWYPFSRNIALTFECWYFPRIVTGEGYSCDAGWQPWAAAPSQAHNRECKQQTLCSVVIVWDVFKAGY